MYWGKFFSVVGDLPDESGISTPEVSDEPEVSVVGGSIRIAGADTHATVQVFDGSGRTVYRGCDRCIDGLPRGFYIVEINGKTAKIIL